MGCFGNAVEVPHGLGHNALLFEFHSTTVTPCAESALLLASVLGISGVVGGIPVEEAQEELLDTQQSDLTYLGAQIEQQWHDFIKVCVVHGSLSVLYALQTNTVHLPITL